MSDSEAPLLCPVCLVSMGVQLSEECAELGEREETYILNTNLTSRGKKLLKLQIKKTRLIKIFEIYRDKSVLWISLLCEKRALLLTDMRCLLNGEEKVHVW